MNRKRVCAIVLAASFVGAWRTVTAAAARSEGNSSVVAASQNQCYPVYYDNVRFPHRIHVSGTDSAIEQTLRLARGSTVLGG